MILSHTNFTDLYIDVLRCLLSDQTPDASPRHMKTKEQIGCKLVLHRPDCNLLVSPARNIQLPFALAEFSWIMCGSNDLAMILPYNGALSRYTDDGMHLSGAYGPQFVEQLPYVIKKLREDPWTRQAVIEIWRPRPMESKDVPCTLTFQFFIRPHDTEGLKLDMVVNMRSNDAWLGLPYDVFTFTMIQKYLAAMFHCVPGTYHHMVGSLHLYETNWNAARQVIAESPGVTWRPQTPRFESLMPGDFKAMYTGLTLMAKHAEANEDMLNWVTMANHMGEPWNTFIKVLAYRFHKDVTHVPNPWHELIINRVMA